MKLGENGVWFGLLISIAYFVPTQSRFGQGQSPGKRILKIQVLDMNGQPLSLAKSFMRYLVIAFAAYISVFTGIVGLLAGSSLGVTAQWIMGILWFVALVGCYLLVPLHPLKRGLHDLIAGSVVVYRGQFSAAALSTLNSPDKIKRAYGIVGGIAAIAIATGIWGLTWVQNSDAIAPLSGIQLKLAETGKFDALTVVDNRVSHASGTTRSIVLQAHVSGPLDQSNEDLKPLYDLAFQTIRDQVKDLSSYNVLRVGLRLGYNLGIRKRYTTRYQDENPSAPGERRDAGSNINL